MTILSISHSQYLETQSTPELFEDAFVIAREFGLVVLQLLTGEELIVRVFEAPVDSLSFTVGEPVAYHRNAGVLACCELWVAAKTMIVS